MKLDEKAADRFLAHLDVCKWCDEHPFNLCATGQKLIQECAPDLQKPVVEPERKP